jgi:hypothetical protein
VLDKGLVGVENEYVDEDDDEGPVCDMVDVER